MTPQVHLTAHVGVGADVGVERGKGRCVGWGREREEVGMGRRCGCGKRERKDGGVGKGEGADAGG